MRSLGLTFMLGGGVSNSYLYNGKELQEDLIGGKPLDWYDYHARFYDAALGRFTTVDPLAEKYAGVSPYAYCANNPMNLADLWGLEPEEPEKPSMTNTVHELPEVVVTLQGNSSNQNWTSDYEEGEFSMGGYSTYQKIYPEFKDIPSDQARDYWEKNYAGAEEAQKQRKLNDLVAAIHQGQMDFLSRVSFWSSGKC